MWIYRWSSRLWQDWKTIQCISICCKFREKNAAWTAIFSIGSSDDDLLPVQNFVDQFLQQLVVDWKKCSKTRKAAVRLFKVCNSVNSVNNTICLISPHVCHISTLRTTNLCLLLKVGQSLQIVLYMSQTHRISPKKI